MRYRQFGKTDLRVSEVRFGTMRFAAKEPGRDEASLNGMRALEEALERGVNCVHSSYEYGTRWATGEVMARYSKRDEVHHVNQGQRSRLGRGALRQGHVPRPGRGCAPRAAR